MKKLIVISAAVFAITVSLTSCDPKKTEPTEGEPATETTVTSEDSTAQPEANTGAAAQDTVTEEHNH